MRLLFLLIASACAQPSSVDLLSHRIAKLVEHEERRHPESSVTPVTAPTCVKAPTLTDFIDLKTETGEDRTIASRLTQEGVLKKPAQQLNDLFHTLEASPRGQAVLKKFFPKFGFEIKVEHFSTEMKEEARSLGRRAAALYDLEKKTIFVDKSRSVGDVAPILLHEMIHSLDGDLSRAVSTEKQLWLKFESEIEQILKAVASRSRKPIAQLERINFTDREMTELRTRKRKLSEFRDIRVFRAERVAYDFYYEIAKELSSLFPDFYGKKPPEPYSDIDVIQAESLSQITIEKFKRGLCEIARL